MLKKIIPLLSCLLLLTCYKTEITPDKDAAPIVNPDSDLNLVDTNEIEIKAYNRVLNMEHLFSETEKKKLSEAYFTDIRLVRITEASLVNDMENCSYSDYYYVLHGMIKDKIIGIMCYDALTGVYRTGIMFYDDEFNRYISSMDEAKQYIRQKMELTPDASIEYMESIFQYGRMSVSWVYTFKIQKKDAKEDDTEIVYYNPYMRISRAQSRSSVSKVNVLPFVSEEKAHRLYKITEATRSGNNPRMVGID